jgi:hypothetical protein
MRKGQPMHVRDRKTRLREIDPARCEPPGASASTCPIAPQSVRFGGRASSKYRHEAEEKNERRRRGVCKDAPKGAGGSRTFKNRFPNGGQTMTGQEKPNPT